MGRGEEGGGVSFIIKHKGKRKIITRKSICVASLSFVPAEYF
jgi:hypothetical protein